MGKNKNQLFKGISTAASIGFQMISSVIVGILLGRFADEYLDSHPWATIVGIVVGMISGMWVIYKKVVEGK